MTVCINASEGIDAEITLSTTMWSERLKRLFNTTRETPNDGPKQLETPEEMIRLAILELEQVIRKVSQALTIATAHQNKLEKDREQCRLESQTWYQQAAVALQAGNEAQAEKSLLQKAVADKKRAAYQAMVEKSAKALGHLQQQLDEYTLQLQEIKLKQTLCTAQSESAKAHRQIVDSLSGLDGSILANLNTYEHTFYELDAEEVNIPLMNSAQTQFDREFRELENKMSVKTDIEQLRSEIEQKNQLKEQKKIATIQQKFEELNKGTNTRSIKLMPTTPPQNLQQKAEPAPEPPKEDQNVPTISQLFEELNNSTLTHQVKLPPSPKEDLSKKIDDFFNNQ